MRGLILILFIFVSQISAQTFNLQKSFSEGIKNAKRGEFEKALKLFQASLPSNKNVEAKFAARVHYNLGVCFYQLKETEKAIGEFERAINLSAGKYQKASYALGMAYTDLHNWSAAENSFQSALKIDSLNGEAWFDLALIYLRQQNYENAEMAFRNAISYKSVAVPDAHNNLGVIFALKDDWQNAEKEFKIALDLSNKTSIEAAENLRFCKFHKQNSDKDLIAKLQFSGSENQLQLSD